MDVLYWDFTSSSINVFKKFNLQKYGFYNENYQIAADFNLFKIILVNKINYKFTDSTYVVMNYGGKVLFLLKVI